MKAHGWEGGRVVRQHGQKEVATLIVQNIFAIIYFLFTTDWSPGLIHNKHRETGLSLGSFSVQEYL